MPKAAKKKRVRKHAKKVKRKKRTKKRTLRGGSALSDLVDLKQFLLRLYDTKGYGTWPETIRSAVLALSNDIHVPEWEVREQVRHEADLPMYQSPDQIDDAILSLPEDRKNYYLNFLGGEELKAQNALEAIKVAASITHGIDESEWVA